MALGFGFNKAKVMQAAERNVLQGKIANAIAEYEKVIAHDPRDLTVQNTLGDLYVRSGRTEDALTCFRKVADAYAADGFAMKAIAMYKKINKLSPHAVECILKLGELYSLQGLFSDARAQYVAAAEHQLSRGDSEAAAGVYRKALELDPENAHMQQRLAELYLSSGKQDQAAEIYIMAAQSLHLRGRHAAALDILEKLLKVAPKHPAALMLCGKVAAESGNHARAVRALEQIPDINERPEALRQLVRVRLASAEVNVAEQDAGKLLASHNDASGVFAVADHLTQNSEAERGLRLLHELSDELIAANTADITRLLQAATADGKSSIPVLEAALQLHRRIADRGSIGEVIELLAQVCVENGHHSRARELYTELVELEPDNEMHQRNLAQLQARAGEPKAAEGAAAEAVDAVAPAPPPNANTGYTSETAQAVEAALTDAELFQSYNSPARAIAALEAVLPQAPRDAGLNHRLATLYVRAERYLDAANCFAVLKKAHEAEGRSEEAEQCAAMEEKYRQRGGAADTRPAANTPSAAQPKPQPAPAGAVPEFDLAPSVPAEAAGFDQPAPAAAGAQPEPEAAAQPARRSEWDEMAVVDEEDPDAGSASTAAASESADPFAAALDEARFYLQHGLHAEAETALRQAEDLRPGAIEVAQLRAQFLLGDHPEAPLPEIQVSQRDEEFEPAPAVSLSVAPAAELHSQPPAELEAASAAPAAADDDLFDLAWELDSALPEDFGLQQSQPAAQPPPSVPAPAARAAVDPRAALEDEPGVALTPAARAPEHEVGVALAPRRARRPQAPAAEPHAAASNGGADAGPARDPFGDIFEEFRSSMEQPESDLEQHYNMGIALKDMGLLDEAVGELQRVCNALERGAEFADAVQAYTWLAHCLVERGAPQAAVRWYKRALSIPSLDPDAQVAIHYELGLAYEKAGVRADALEHFMEAYGSNIDYRDVAERIEALRG